MISPHDIEFYILGDPSQGWLYDFTAASIRFWGGQPTSIKSLKEIKTGKQYAVVQTPGHIIHTREFFSGLYCYVPFLVQGHILAKEPSYIKLHPQCFLIDVHVAQKFHGFDPDLQVSDFPTFKLSAEHFHDTYTPHFATRDTGEVKVEPTPFNNLVAQQLKMFGRVDAFSQRTRTGKHNIYTHDAHSEFASKRQFQMLKQKQEQCIYLMHTDTIVGTGYYDTVLTTASGLKPALVNDAYGPSKLVVYDISKPAIEWQRALKVEWDGEDLMGFFNSKQGFNVPRVLPVGDKAAEEWHKFKLERPWCSIWKNYKERGVEFYHCDLLSWDIPVKGRTLLDVSNIFTQPFLRFELSEIDLYDQLTHFLGKYSNKDLFILGLTPKWQYCNGIHVTSFIDKLTNEIQKA